MLSYDEALIAQALREYGDLWQGEGSDVSLAKHLAPLLESARREGYEQAMEDVRIMEEKNSLNDEFGD